MVGDIADDLDLACPDRQRKNRKPAHPPATISTRVFPAKRSCNTEISRGSISRAITFPAFCASSAVRNPRPAPISTTVSSPSARPGRRSGGSCSDPPGRTVRVSSGDECHTGRVLAYGFHLSPYVTRMPSPGFHAIIEAGSEKIGGMSGIATCPPTLLATGASLFRPSEGVWVNTRGATGRRHSGRGRLYAPLAGDVRRRRRSSPRCRCTEQAEERRIQFLNAPHRRGTDPANGCSRQPPADRRLGIPKSVAAARRVFSTRTSTMAS